MCSFTLSDFTRDELAQGRSPSDVAAMLATHASPDLSFISELWNAGPIGRAVALQIADQSAVQKALAETQK